MTKRPALRGLWLAASHPRAFFARLDDEPRLGPALVVMAASAMFASVVAATLVIRGTRSDAWLPFLLGTPTLVLPYLFVIVLLGGLVLMRPAALDLRAFEITAWAWTPSGVLAVSLLPIGWIAPWPTLIVGTLLLLPAWHLWLVWRGLEVHAETGRRAAFLLYVAVVFALPTVLTLFTVTILSNL